MRLSAPPHCRDLYSQRPFRPHSASCSLAQTCTRTITQGAGRLRRASFTDANLAGATDYVLLRQLPNWRIVCCKAWYLSAALHESCNENTSFNASIAFLSMCRLSPGRRFGLGICCVHACEPGFFLHDLAMADAFATTA